MFERPNWFSVKAAKVNFEPQKLSFIAALFAVVGTSASAQSTAANSVVASGPAPTFFTNPAVTSCVTNVAVVSNGVTGNPGICIIPNPDPAYTLTFTFSPADSQRMTGINVWSNAGGNVADGELREFDLEVDHFNPSTGANETLTLNDVNIGDTTSFAAASFAAFPSQLFRVTEIRMSDMRGIPAPLPSFDQAIFREVQGVLVTVPVAPEISISSSVTGAIGDGGSDTQGAQPAGVAQTITYTIRNEGTTTLTLSGTPTVSNLANVNGPVSMTAPGALSLAPGATTTFDVTYTTTAGGPFSFDLDVLSNDADESTYDIAVTGAGNDAPTVVLTAPPGAQAGPFTLTATFSEAVSGLALADFVIGNGTVSNLVMISPNVYTVLVTPTTPGADVTASLPASTVTDGGGAPNAASNILNITSGALTDAQREEIRNIVQQEAVRVLRTELQANQRFTQSARERHIAALRCRVLQERVDLTDAELEELQVECSAENVSQNAVPLGLSGSFLANADNANLFGRFFNLDRSLDNERRRFFYGELDVTRFDEGDVIGSLTARYAWERLVAKDVLVGSFVGINASRSTIHGSFSGDRDGYGVDAGVYFVDQLSENLFWDGFAAVSVGRNDLDIQDTTVGVGSDYTTESYQVGLAVSGVKEFETFELRPELSLVYGYTDIGNIDLDVAVGSTTLSDALNAGNVALGRLSFAPEFVFPVRHAGRLYDATTFRATPSLTCEYLSTTSSSSDCGGGLELEWNASSSDNLKQISIRLSREILGGSTRDSIAFQFGSAF